MIIKKHIATYTHPLEADKTEQKAFPYKIHVSRTLISEKILAKFKEHYPTICYTIKRRATFDLSSIKSPEAQYRCWQDITFYNHYSQLPNENIFCSFSNFKPKNESQETALTIANRFVKASETETTSPKALLLYGPPGTGKTHLALSICKQLLLKKTIYIYDGKKLDTKKLKNSYVVLFDDFNSGYGVPGYDFQLICTHILNINGSLIITSNADPEKLISSSFVGPRDSAKEIAKFEQQFNGNFLYLNVQAESHRQRQAWFNDTSALSTAIPTFQYNNAPEAFSANPQVFTESVVRRFTSHYSGLECAPTAEKEVEFNASNLQPKDRCHCWLDALFFNTNPEVALENLFCNMENFKIETDSQKELFEWAARLINLDSSDPAGLMLSGKPGIGKTHISIAIAKAFLAQGLTVYYTPSKYSIEPSRLEKADIVIIDDFNSGYAREELLPPVLNHFLSSARTKPRLMITSNSDIKEVIKQTFVARSEYYQKYESRMSSSLKYLTIEGKNYRKAKAWYLDESALSNDAPTIPDTDAPQSFTADPSIFNDAVVNHFTSHYSGLKCSLNDEGQVEFNLSSLSLRDKNHCWIDALFFNSNPEVALENLFCKMENFKIETKSQQHLFNWSARLVNLSSSDPAGLMLSGPPGIGKTHMSIAIAKAYLAQGLNVYFTKSTYSADTARLETADVVIIDDFNAGYARDQLLLPVMNHVLSSERTKARLMITSNSDISTVIKQVFVGKEADYAKYKSRAASSLKYLQLQGESYRRARAWYLDKRALSVETPHLPDYKTPETLTVSSRTFTEEICGKFQDHYPNLKFRRKSNSEINISLSNVAAQNRFQCFIDSLFFAYNPDLNPRYLFYKLPDLQITHPSQKDMLKWAYQLMNLQSNAPAGLVVSGKKRTGKTLLAVGMAKLWLAQTVISRHIEPVYFIKNDYYIDERRLHAARIFILDGLDKAYGRNDLIQTLLKRFLSSELSGTRLIITTQTDTNKIINQLVAGKKEEKARYSDRIHTTLQSVSLQADSYPLDKSDIDYVEEFYKELGCRATKLFPRSKNQFEETTTLSFSKNDLKELKTQDQWWLFINMLKKYHNLQSVSLNMRIRREEDLKSLCQALQSKPLKSIDLCNSDLSDRHIEIITNHLKISGLNEFDLRDNNITCQGLKDLIKFALKHNYKFVNLCINKKLNITEKDVKVIKSLFEETQTHKIALQKLAINIIGSVSNKAMLDLQEFFKNKNIILFFKTADKFID
ncbi:ATP-binding protein [Thermoproteota archaeon]